MYVQDSGEASRAEFLDAPIPNDLMNMLLSPFSTVFQHRNLVTHYESIVDSGEESKLLCFAASKP